MSWFYAAAIMIARCVVRDEPWLAKGRDWDAAQELLKMIEWDHRPRYGGGYRTWFLGKNLGRWMDADVREALDRCWAAFPVSGASAALVATMDLYDRLASRTAEALGLPEPSIDAPEQRSPGSSRPCLATLVCSGASGALTGRRRQLTPPRRTRPAMVPGPAPAPCPARAA